MHSRIKPAMPMARTNMRSALLAERPNTSPDLMPATLVEEIKLHLGGEERLARIGARSFVVDHDDVTFRLCHDNPSGAKTIVIRTEPGGLFSMKCYGALAPGCLSAPVVGQAWEIVPDNLATVLGKLTGLEELHHRHY